MEIKTARKFELFEDKAGEYRFRLETASSFQVNSVAGVCGYCDGGECFADTHDDARAGALDARKIY